VEVFYGRSRVTPCEVNIIGIFINVNCEKSIVLFVILLKIRLQVLLEGKDS